MKTKRILVTGSRTWENHRRIREELFNAWRELSADGSEVILVSGAAKGADTMAERVWRGLGLIVERHPVEWRPHGIYNPQAGLVRNREMIALGADLCLAFIHHNSGGASHCARFAKLNGIPVRVFRDGELPKPVMAEGLEAGE